MRPRLPAEISEFFEIAESICLCGWVNSRVRLLRNMPVFSGALNSSRAGMRLAIFPLLPLRLRGSGEACLPFKLSGLQFEALLGLPVQIPSQCVASRVGERAARGPLWT